MIRFLISLISRLALGCIIIVLLALGIGRILPPEPEIMFTASFDLHDLNIYRISLTRQITMAVTHHPANEFLPDWSPDGQHIAFVSDRDGNYNIYMTDAQGRGLQRLLKASTSNQYNPAWSPDGKSIAYINEAKGYGEVMVYDIATGSSESLTDSYRTHISPVWSVDGKSITFVSDLDERWNTKIYSVDIASRVISPILVGSALNPAWSPDGRYLVYTSGNEKVNLYLWDDVLKTSALLYTGGTISNDTPAWSPDGRSIIYSAFTSNANSGIFQLSIADCLRQSGICTPQLLTLLPGSYRNPCWKPTQ